MYNEKTCFIFIISISSIHMIPLSQTFPTDVCVKNCPFLTINLIVDAKTYTINITFPGANYIWLHTENLIPSFKEEVASAVAMLTNISRQRVMTVELHSKPVVTYAFDLLPSSYPGDGMYSLC